jgi:hypothetical protein
MSLTEIKSEQVVCPYCMGVDPALNITATHHTFVICTMCYERFSVSVSKLFITSKIDKRSLTEEEMIKKHDDFNTLKYGSLIKGKDKVTYTLIEENRPDKGTHSFRGINGCICVDFRKFIKEDYTIL